MVVYGARTVLGPISLTLDPGASLALVGPSGCGKSTLLRLLADLERPTSGDVDRTTGRGETAVVFQAPTLAPWASVLANASLPLKLAGRPKTEAEDRARAALSQVGLSGVETLKPAQLSGGMAMRVSLARAMSTDPKLLLLDEPFAALDEVTRRQLADDVLKLTQSTGAAMVFVTHSVEEAAYMANRVLVLEPNPGRILEDIRIEAPLPRPAQFRANPLFRDTVERVSQELQNAMNTATFTKGEQP
jgi:NitT/TauT family transport system ATP-binding protein